MRPVASTRRAGFNIDQPNGVKFAAGEITRQSKSNLALAFISLGRERRRDITVFYAFCRVIDDIADAADFDKNEKRRRLMDWRGWLHSATAEEPPLAAEVRSVLRKYSIAPELPEEIISGVEMDLDKSRYATFEELRVYCYRVASAVGLVSIEIFGYHNPGCKDYAVELGLALQMTNIIRDVGKDLQNGRVYLPEEDLAHFDYSEAELRDRQYNDRFVHLMEFEAARAREFFNRAAALLPCEDRRSMVAAQIMASIYSALLRRIEKANFRVFDKEYRLSKWEKAGRITAQLVKCF
jgi:phytoene synthase